jgi:WD40 repeat protein
LATGSSNGSIASWDLSKGGRLLHVNREAHELGVTGLEFVPGQQLLISSSGDNSVKVSLSVLHDHLKLTFSNGYSTRQRLFLDY